MSAAVAAISKLGVFKEYYGSAGDVEMSSTAGSVQALVDRVAAIFGGLPAHLQAALTLKSLKSSAVLGAVVVLAVRFAVLRSRRARRVTHFERIARRVKDGKSSRSAEYDVVIAGGGECAGTARVRFLWLTCVRMEGRRDAYLPLGCPRTRTYAFC